MKLALIFTFISFLSLSQFQSLENADWTFHRADHQLHYFGSIGLAIVSSGFATYRDLDNPNIKRGLVVGTIISGGVAVGKEVIIDLAFGLGSPTYPDLVYSFAGVAVGLITTYIMYKIDNYLKK